MENQSSKSLSKKLTIVIIAVVAVFGILILSSNSNLFQGNIGNKANKTCSQAEKTIDSYAAKKIDGQSKEAAEKEANTLKTLINNCNLDKKNSQLLRKAQNAYNKRMEFLGSNDIKSFTLDGKGMEGAGDEDDDEMNAPEEMEFSGVNAKPIINNNNGARGMSRPTTTGGDDDEMNAPEEMEFVESSTRPDLTNRSMRGMSRPTTTGGDDDEMESPESMNVGIGL